MEQRDLRPQRPTEDIASAAAEAMAQADEYEAAPGYREPAPRGPRRWLVVGGVTVAALALAGTAAAIVGMAGHSNSPRHDTALNVAETQTTTPPATSLPNSATTDGTSAPTTPPATTAPTRTPAPKSSPGKTPSKAPTSQAAEDGGDCENTTHDTPADEAVNFSGMTGGTQQAFLSAQKAAKAAGQHSFVLNSGYRSAAYQQRVFDCWVKQLGSPQAARKYALPPNESAHVKGYAMDIAPPSAAAWLQSTKGEYGLCRRYEDETWHFEYEARYKTEGCPAMLPQP